jgi:hypothetical protein
MAGTRITFVVEVEAIASCNLSTARILLPGKGLVTNDEKVAVEVEAIDVDNLAIDSSTPAFIAKWDGANQSTDEGWIPMRRRQGNVFFAEIPVRLRASARSYQLEVVLENGWDGNLPQQCTLLRELVMVKEAEDAVQTWMVLAAAIVGCILLVLGTVIYVRRHSDRLHAMLVMILTETGAPLCVSVPLERTSCILFIDRIEMYTNASRPDSPTGKLITSICLEIADLIT